VKMVISLGAITRVHRLREFLKNSHLKSRSIWHNIETYGRWSFVGSITELQLLLQGHRRNKNRSLSRFVLCPRLITRYVVSVCEGPQGRR